MRHRHSRFERHWRHWSGEPPWADGPGGRPSPNRLYRNIDNAMLKGVCAGIADYFGIAAWIVRIGVLIALFAFTIPTIIVYVVMARVVPPRPPGLFETPGEEAFWTRVRVEPTGTISSLRRRFIDMERSLRDVETFVTSREFRLNREINDL